MTGIHLLRRTSCLHCGDSYPAHELGDGLCVHCHPAIFPDQDRSNRGYVSPDAYERHGEYYDHRDDAARNRVVDNAGWA